MNLHRIHPNFKLLEAKLHGKREKTLNTHKLYLLVGDHIVTVKGAYRIIFFSSIQNDKK